MRLSSVVGGQGRLYHDNVIDHYEVRGRARVDEENGHGFCLHCVFLDWFFYVCLSQNPRNVGSLDPKNKEVGSGLVGAPACGDVMKFQVRVQDGVVRVVLRK